MTCKERVSTIRLLEKINRQPEYAKQIGLIIEMKRDERLQPKQQRVQTKGVNE